MYNIVIIICLVFCALGLLYFSIPKRKVVMSFKEGLDLTGLPIITFTQNNSKYNFLIDTGSVDSHINKTLIEKNIVEATPVEGYANVIGCTGEENMFKKYKVSLQLLNNTFEDIFVGQDLERTFNTIKESTGVSLHGIIGAGFLEKYKYVIDFSKYIVYNK